MKKHIVSLIVKTVVWRVLSFSIALFAGRMWFGNWHVSGFTIFITLLLMIVYYLFELIWLRVNRRR